jgi:hypothetical protein
MMRIPHDCFWITVLVINNEVVPDVVLGTRPKEEYLLTSLRRPSVRSYIIAIAGERDDRRT